MCLLIVGIFLCVATWLGRRMSCVDCIAHISSCLVICLVIPRKWMRYYSLLMFWESDLHNSLNPWLDIRSLYNDKRMHVWLFHFALREPWRIRSRKTFTLAKDWMQCTSFMSNVVLHLDDALKKLKWSFSGLSFMRSWVLRNVYCSSLSCSFATHVETFLRCETGLHIMTLFTGVLPNFPFSCFFCTCWSSNHFKVLRPLFEKKTKNWLICTS